MKVARLPDGTELEFDDSLSDRAIEAAVRAHLGVDDDDDDSTDTAIDIEELLLEFVSVAKSLRTAIVAMTKAQGDTSAKIERLAKSNADVVKAVGEVAGAIGDSMGRHGKAVTSLGESIARSHAEQADAADKMSKRLYDLGRTISEDKGELKALAAGFDRLGAKVDDAAEAVTAALRAPKTIRTNKDGRPTGIDVG